VTAIAPPALLVDQVRAVVDELHPRIFPASIPRRTGSGSGTTNPKT
jgi:hypothetical protein